MSGSELVRSFYENYYANQAFLEQEDFRMAWRRAFVREIASGGAARSLRQQQFEEFLDQLDPQDLQIILLHYFQQQSLADTAAEIGISVAAANQRYLNAIQRIREILTDEFEGEAGGADV